MPDTAARLQQLREEAESAVRAARSSAELEDLRVRFLGRRSELTGVLRSIGELPADERGQAGQAATSVRQAVESLLEQRARDLESTELDARLASDRIDVTLPGDPPSPNGHLHLITQTRREIEDVFVGLGFSVVEGPEIEFDYYNFTALNMPPAHPARAIRSARARAGSRSSARAWSTRTSTASWRSVATTRSASRVSHSGWGSSGSRCCATASPTCGCSSTTIRASWSNSGEGPALVAAAVLRSAAIDGGGRRSP